MSAPSLRDLFERRFLFVTGKGGVGKTSVAAALAQTMASQGRKVLLVASAEGDALAHTVGLEALPLEIEEIRPGLSVVRITLERALLEYGRLMLHGGKLFDSVFNNQALQSFFRGVPGLSEWAILGKAWYHSTELGSDGAPRFDTVILDAPATGHGVGMLWVPRVVVEIAPVGLLRRDAELALRMFQDPKLSAVVIVTLPEEMPTNETLELAQAVKGDLKLPLGMLVVNQCTAVLFSAEQGQFLASVPVDRSTEVGRVLVVAAGRARAEVAEATQIQRLEQLGAPLLELPTVRGSSEPAQVVRELMGVFSSFLQDNPT